MKRYHPGNLLSVYVLCVPYEYWCQFYKYRVLNRYLGGTKLSVGADNDPYITYKVGADSVTKKLGSGKLTRVLSSITLVGEPTYIVATHNMTSFTSDYQKLTLNDFLVETLSFTGRNGMSNSTVASNIGKSYNNTTGILTVTVNKTLMQWGIIYNVWMVL